jgi:hypothetical protein
MTVKEARNLLEKVGYNIREGRDGRLNKGQYLRSKAGEVIQRMQAVKDFLIEMQEVDVDLLIKAVEELETAYFE